MARQRVGERRPGPDALRHVLHDVPQAATCGDVAQDDQGPLERETGLDQGGQLLREVEDLAGGHPGRAEQAPSRPTFLVGHLDAQRVVVLAMQALDDGVGVERLHHAVDGPSGPVGRPVGEDWHYASMSSTVTRRTSSTVVTPRQHLLQPSWRRLVMPAAIARCRISCPGVFRRARLRISSDIAMNS